MAYMENETGVATWNAWASGPTDLWGFTWFNGPALYYANDMDDCDGSPWRRQDVAFQWTQNIYMPVLRAAHSTIVKAAISRSRT